MNNTKQEPDNRHVMRLAILDLIDFVRLVPLSPDKREEKYREMQDLSDVALQYMLLDWSSELKSYPREITDGRK